MNVLNLEREMLAESLGVDVNTMPTINDSDHVMHFDTEVIELDHELST